MKNKYLEAIFPRFEAVKHTIESDFGALSSDALNWKVNPKQWSIGQCLDHLITSNTTYFSMFESLAIGTRKKSFIEGFSLWAKLWGNTLYKQLQPTPTTKMKSPPAFKPSASTIPENIVSKYMDHQVELVELIRRMDWLTHEKVIVTSPASPIITYTLKRNIEILANHEERHLLQAQNVKAHPAFPI